MNTNHYPDIERCNKLTEIVFPFGELHYFNDKIETTDGLHEWAENHLGVYDKSFRCPSVMEMLDVIPKFHENLGWLVIRPMASGWSVGYDEHNVEILGELPNALADLIFWLHENNYIKF